MRNQSVIGFFSSLNLWETWYRQSTTLRKLLKKMLILTCTKLYPLNKELGNIPLKAEMCLTTTPTDWTWDETVMGLALSK